MRKIMFPKAEKSAIKSRLRSEGNVVTTRVSRELGKYKVGDRLEYAGFILDVVRVERFGDLVEHPFLDELDDRMRKEIERFGEFDVVWLVLSGHDSTPRDDSADPAEPEVMG